MNTEQAKIDFQKFTSSTLDKVNIDNAKLIRRLEKPAGMIDVVLDTDTYNEIDDQFALSYMVRSTEKLNHTFLFSEIEAARVDGASWMTIIWKIVFPISIPVFVTAGLMIFMSQWNSYMWPLPVARSKEIRTIQLAITVFAPPLSELLGSGTI